MKYYYIVKCKIKRLGRFDIKTQDQLEDDEVIHRLHAWVWFEFHEKYRDKISDMSIEEFKERMISFEKEVTSRCAK